MTNFNYKVINQCNIQCESIEANNMMFHRLSTVCLSLSIPQALFTTILNYSSVTMPFNIRLLETFFSPKTTPCTLLSSLLADQVFHQGQPQIRHPAALDTSSKSCLRSFFHRLPISPTTFTLPSCPIKQFLTPLCFHYII